MKMMVIITKLLLIRISKNKVKKTTKCYEKVAFFPVKDNNGTQMVHKFLDYQYALLHIIGNSSALCMCVTVSVHISVGHICIGSCTYDDVFKFFYYFLWHLCLRTLYWDAYLRVASFLYYLFLSVCLSRHATQKLRTSSTPSTTSTPR